MKDEIVKEMEIDKIKRFLAEISEEKEKPTERTYRSLLLPFGKWLGGREFSSSLIRKYMNDKGWKPRSKNTFLGVIKSYAKWRIDHIPVGVTPEELRAALTEQQRLNQIKAMSRPKVPRVYIKQKGFSLKELTHLINAAEVPDAAWMYLLAYFGLRKGELNHIRDIDFGRGRIIVMTEKAKEKVGERLLCFNSECAGVLKRALNSGWLDHKFNSSFLNNRFEKYRSELNGKPIKPHAFRHTFNTQMRLRLGDDILVKRLMGHTIDKRDMTATYTDFVEKQIKRAMTDFHYMNDLKIDTARMM